MDHAKLVLESQEDAEKAIIEETRTIVGLEFAELSVTIRELLAKVYIRGGLDVIKKLHPKTK